MVSSPPPPQAQAQAQAQAYGAAGAGAHTQGALGGYALPEAAETYALPAQEGYYGANEAYEAPVAAGGAQVSEYYATLRLEPETFDEVWDAALEALQDGKTLVSHTPTAGGRGASGTGGAEKGRRARACGALGGGGGGGGAPKMAPPKI